MEHIGQSWRVRPGKRADYIRRHAQVWPDLEEKFRKWGVADYAIYISGDLVFSHLSVQDYGKFVAEYNADELAQSWEEEFQALVEYTEADAATRWPVPLTHVWSLPERPMS